MAGNNGPVPPPQPSVPAAGSGGKQNPRATKTVSSLLDAKVPGASDFLRAYNIPSSFWSGKGRGDSHAHIVPGKDPGVSLAGFRAAFLQMDPAHQAQIQSLLYRAGFYGSGSGFVPMFGHIKDEDYAALTTALSMAVQQHIDFGMYLVGSANAADRSGVRDPGKIHAPKVIDLTDPNTLNMSLHDAFKSALGRDPTEKEKTAFVTAFHARESAYGEQKAAASQQALDAQLGQTSKGPVTPESQGLMYVTGQGYVPNPNYVPPAGAGAPAAPTTVTLTPPDYSSSAKAQALDQHPNEAKAFALGQNGQQILAALTQASPEPGR